MRVADFDYELPQDRIAARPAEPRDAARLLVFDRRTGERRHLFVRDLPSVLRPGDLLVLNDTRVLPWRLVGRRASGGRVECLLLRLDTSGGAGGGGAAGLAAGEAFVKPSQKLREGETIELEGGALRATLRERGEGGRWTLDLAVGAAGGAGGDVEAALERYGRAPLPPYLPDAEEGGGASRREVAAERDRYQTVFAREPGAIAAPTAGLHFTEELLDALRTRGVGLAYVTLHVGEGTFAPLRTDVVEEHRMHAERYELPPATAEAVAATRRSGGRVIPVGTTSCRTLEACARDDGTVAAGRGTTDVFLYPGKRFRVTDALLTNFHLPRSTLLMLVAAFAGRDEVLAVYREAIAQGYRFFSFGDAMLVV